MHVLLFVHTIRIYLFILFHYVRGKERKKVARARLLTTILPVVVDHGETAGTTQQAP
jgi:hypothetical protein